MREYMHPGEAFAARLPWVQPGAYFFMEGFFLNRYGCEVLEFGSGGSTLWLSDHGQNVTAVEHVTDWAETVVAHLNPKCSLVEMLIHPRPYANADELNGKFFEFILVDGRDRVACVQRAMELLIQGGVLMLDNSERAQYGRAVEMLRGWERFDAVGKWTTSWWIKRA